MVQQTCEQATLSDNFFLTALARRANDVIIATRADRIDAPDGPAIVYCNPAFEQMTGWRRDEVMGETPRILQTPDTDRAELDRIRAALIAWNAGDETAEVHVEVENQRRNGERYWADIQLVPVWSPDYAASYWISIQRDVTARRMREDNLRQAMRMDGDARRETEALFDALSEDLREPLNAVVGFSELLNADALSPRQAGSVAHIAEAGRRLQGMAASIADLSELMRGGGAVQIEPMPACDLTDAVIAAARPTALRAGVHLRLDGVAEARLRCDGRRARRCLATLVDNAISVSPRGGTVAISVDAIEGRVAIAVSDEGPGLDEAGLAAALAGRAPGGNVAMRTGLGLPVARSLMALQGGMLTGVGAPGEGVTMALVFPEGGAVI